MRQGPSERNLPGQVFVTPGGGDANPSLEKTALGPPRDPGRHLSMPDTHPTPGQYTWLPGQPFTAAPFGASIMNTTTAKTAAATNVHLEPFFICLWPRLLRPHALGVRLGRAATPGGCLQLADAAAAGATALQTRQHIEKPGRFVVGRHFTLPQETFPDTCYTWSRPAETSTHTWPTQSPRGE